MSTRHMLIGKLQITPKKIINNKCLHIQVNFVSWHLVKLYQ